MKADWIAPKRTAVLVIDCQVDFGGPDGEMARRGADMRAPQAALSKAQELVTAARGAGVAETFNGTEDGQGASLV
jgi:nicotinamidase-related amidase